MQLPDSRDVKVQLDRILATPLFQFSKRYPAFLRYIVEKTLEGAADTLKERTLGVAVFGRSPDYDTSADPVVRNTASNWSSRNSWAFAWSRSRDAARRSVPSRGRLARRFSTAASAVLAFKASDLAWNWRSSTSSSGSNPLRRASSWARGVASVNPFRIRTEASRMPKSP